MLAFLAGIGTGILCNLASDHISRKIGNNGSLEQGVMDMANRNTGYPGLLPEDFMPPTFQGGVDDFSGGVDGFAAVLGKAITNAIKAPSGRLFGMGKPGVGGSGLVLLGSTAGLAPGASTAGNLTFTNVTNSPLHVRRITLEHSVTASGIITTPGLTLVNSILIGGIPVTFGARGIPLTTFQVTNQDFPAMDFVLQPTTSVVLNILNGPLVATIDGCCWCTPPEA